MLRPYATCYSVSQTTTVDSSETSEAAMSAKNKPAKNEDLHGSAPDKSAVALLLIDVINDLDFLESRPTSGYALPMASRIAVLKKRAQLAGVPVIYVNDNFGRWRSDFNAQVEHCLEKDCRGRPIAELLRPERGRLLRSQAQALRVLFDDARHAA